MIFIATFTALAVVGVTAGIVLWQDLKADDDNNDQVTVDPPQMPPPSESELGQYSQAAVSCDAPVCAQIGKWVLKHFDFYLLNFQSKTN